MPYRVWDMLYRTLSHVGDPPGMPQGKQAGIRCIQLTADNICKIYGMAERPDVCVSYQATEDLCGKNRLDALRLLCELEQSTSRSVE